MKRITMPLLPVLAFALVCPALAAQNQQQQTNQQSQQKNQQRAKAQSQKQKLNVNGTLTDFRAVTLKGQQQKHMLGKVKLQDGKTIVIDLGPASGLKQQNVELRKDQKVQASGYAGRINNLPVLIVNRYVGDGKFTLIVPTVTKAHSQGQVMGMPMPSNPRQQAQRGTKAYVFGTLTDTQNIDLKGVSDQHRLVKLRTSRGFQVVVDLGGSQKLKDISLQKGERLMAVGALGRINGKPVIFATQVADVVDIDRPNAAAQGNQTMNQQQNRQSQQTQQNHEY